MNSSNGKSNSSDRTNWESIWLGEKPDVTAQLTRYYLSWASLMYFCHVSLLACSPCPITLHFVLFIELEQPPYWCTVPLGRARCQTVVAAFNVREEWGSTACQRYEKFSL
ncbi:Uncharacterised protein [Mycobacteroides abscessus subsp. abscessus]|nr:Uncharacterised protein [Mycobacteroides abscessus subsp. abscessus]